MESSIISPRSFSSLRGSHTPGEHDDLYKVIHSRERQSVEAAFLVEKEFLTAAHDRELAKLLRDHEDKVEV